MSAIVFMRVRSVVSATFPRKETHKEDLLEHLRLKFSDVADIECLVTWGGKMVIQLICDSPAYATALRLEFEREIQSFLSGNRENART